MLVVGTEAGDIIILNPAGTEILKRWKLPSAPVYMAITGVKDIEFRIVCACRDGNVHSIKESGPSGVVIELESMPCGLARQDKNILVGCMSNVIHAFSLRGKKQYSIYLPGAISCMELLSLTKTRTAKALLVGMASGEVSHGRRNQLGAVARAPPASPVAPLSHVDLGAFRSPARLRSPADSAVQ